MPNVILQSKQRSGNRNLADKEEAKEKAKASVYEKIFGKKKKKKPTPQEELADVPEPSLGNM